MMNPLVGLSLIHILEGIIAGGAIYIDCAIETDLIRIRLVNCKLRILT